ncbi:MAG: ABC transporter transmembrane domain-containing protein, partial [Planctomycetota bacterium]
MTPDRRALTLLWSQRTLGLGVLACAAVYAAATAAYGALAGPLLRALFGGGPLTWPAAWVELLPRAPDVADLRRWLPGLVAGLAVVKGLAWYGQAIGAARIGQRAIHTLRMRLHARLLDLPPDVVRALGAGELNSRFTHDADRAEALLTSGVPGIVRDGLQVVALVALCLAIDQQLALLAFAVYPLALVPMIRFVRGLRRAAGNDHTDRAALSTELHRQIERLPLVQLSSSQPEAAASFDRAASRVERAVLHVVRLRASASPLMEVLGAGALAGTFMYAGARIEAGALAAEHVLSFFTALLLLYQPVKGLVRAQTVLQTGRVAFDRIWEILDLPDRLPRGGDEAPPARAPGIVIRGLSVARGGRPALAATDVDLPAGAITALQGPNGSGKTTLAWALAGLLPATDGEITVDGRPLHTLDLARWRSTIGWIGPDAAPGGGTLRTEVTRGLAGITPDRVA